MIGAAAAARPIPVVTSLHKRVAALRGVSAGLVAGALGVIAHLAHAPIYFWPALLIGLVGFVWLLDGAYVLPARKVTAAVWRGWCFGFGYFFGGLWWVALAFIERGPEFAPWGPPGALALGAGLAIFWAVGAGVAVSLWRLNWTRIGVFTLVFGVVELARGMILTGFPWNAPAHVWMAGGAVSQGAALVGANGLSIITLFALSAPAALAGPDTKPAARFGPPLVALALIGGLFVSGFARLELAQPTGETGVRLRVIQTDISQADKWDRANRERILGHYLDMTTQPGLESRTHVVWPESPLPFFLLEEPRALDAIAREMGDEQVLLTGVVRRDMTNPLAPTAHNSFVALAFPNGLPTVDKVYDKHHLVPFGEYVPMRALLSRLGFMGLNRQTSGDFTPGSGPATIRVPGAPPLAPQICYEVIFPGLTPRGADRPGWIVNVSNDAWYGDTPGPRQKVNQARYRAIEEGVPVVRSTSGGISLVTDSYGRLVRAAPMASDAVLDVDLPRSIPPTLYAILGDAGTILMLIIALGVMAAPSGNRALKS